MKRILICTGVLGGGTALVFAAAVGASAMFPNGGTIAATNQMMFMKGGMAFPGQLGGGGVNFATGVGGQITTGVGGQITTVNADGSVTITGIAAPVPAISPVPVQAPDATTGP